jgi:N-acetylglutamate synthase-like GNAT family acetyltransferase
MSNKFSTRATTLRDELLLSELLTASYPVLMEESYDATTLAVALPLMTRANTVLLSSGTYYLTENEDGTIVGCGGWSLERPGTGEIAPSLAHIRHFATHPDWTGRGIGRAIYAKCENAARSANVVRFECYASLNAEGFYSSLGFEKVRLVAVQMAPELKFPSVLMKRLL